MIGYVYDALAEKTTLINKNEPSNKYGEAKLVDGLLIATQYDLPWRDDLFDGWHFYDVSQCCEFLLKKYKVRVPNQYNSEGVAVPWCLHYVGTSLSMVYYEKYRSAFRREYRELISSKDNSFAGGTQLEPGISILLLVGNHIDAIWMRMDEFERQMSKDDYELIVAVNQLDSRIQKLFKQEGIKVIFVEPGESAASYINRAISIAEKEYDVMLLDCRFSVSGSFALAMQNAFHDAEDVGACPLRGRRAASWDMGAQQ
jgi:hypothetical protein